MERSGGETEAANRHVGETRNERRAGETRWRDVGERRAGETRWRDALEKRGRQLGCSRTSGEQRTDKSGERSIAIKTQPHCRLEEPYGVEIHFFERRKVHALILGKE